MERRDRRVRNWLVSGATALVVAGGLWVASAQGQQPTPQPATEPAIQAAVSTSPNPDGSYHVEYQIPQVPAGIRFLENPRVRVLNAKGELMASIPMVVFERGGLLVGFGDYRLPWYEKGNFQVSVQVPFARADGSKALAADVRTLTVP